MKKVAILILAVALFFVGCAGMWEKEANSRVAFDR
jgi:PBP1b-binding outer membrane lipoprotein LpoB